MRPVLFLAMIPAIMAPVEARTADFDAVAAAPNSHRVLMEDDRIRVLRVEIAPGATEPVHDHRWPSLMYFEQPQPITYITYRLVEGRPAETGRIDAPAFEASQAVRAEPEGLHAVKNRGSQPFVAVRIEFKDGGRSRPTGASPRPADRTVPSLTPASHGAARGYPPRVMSLAVAARAKPVAWASGAKAR